MHTICHDRRAVCKRAADVGLIALYFQNFDGFADSAVVFTVCF